mmetsp:Transcript_2708/g.7649  ORF Transcript_2708/g.7649 Transcript_2708/m.7649 type:complete len:266 (-) Transcript_2708:475-1272(-)
MGQMICHSPLPRCNGISHRGGSRPAHGGCSSIPTWKGLRVPHLPGGMARVGWRETRASASPARYSSLRSARSSARVGPTVKIAKLAPLAFAALMSRKTEYTIRLEPTTSMASFSSAMRSAWSAVSLGTLAPKKTTAGFRTPSQWRQGGTRKSCDSWASLSPSGRFTPWGPSRAGSELAFPRAEAAMISALMSSKISCRDFRSMVASQLMQTTLCVVPWSSTTSLLPALWCRRSTFWVMSPFTQPISWSCARAWWAGLQAVLANSW